MYFFFSNKRKWELDILIINNKPERKVHRNSKLLNNTTENF